MSKIKVYMHNPGNWGPEEMAGKWPTHKNDHFEWTSEPQDIALWVDTGGGANQYDDFLRQYQSVNAKYNIFALVEPEKLCPGNYVFVKKHEDKFDLILSTYPDFGGDNPKYKYYSGGLRSYVRSEVFKVYEKYHHIVSPYFPLLVHLPKYSCLDEFANNNLLVVQELQVQLYQQILLFQLLCISYQSSTF